nr:MAG TPA_asm: putative peptide binding protein [Caudoviricetes sp.]
MGSSRIAVTAPVATAKKAKAAEKRLFGCINPLP